MLTETLDIHTPPGMHAIFTGNGGYEAQQNRAKEILKVGGTYVIEEIDIGGWNSDVSLEGVTGSFNTCLFENAPGYVPATEDVVEDEPPSALEDIMARLEASKERFPDYTPGAIAAMLVRSSARVISEPGEPRDSLAYLVLEAALAGELVPMATAC